jgi:hypothetical protein
LEGQIKQTDAPLPTIDNISEAGTDSSEEFNPIAPRALNEIHDRDRGLLNQPLLILGYPVMPVADPPAHLVQSLFKLVFHLLDNLLSQNCTSQVLVTTHGEFTDSTLGVNKAERYWGRSSQEGEVN